MVLLILAAAMPLSIAVANVALGVAVLLLVRRLLVERGTFRRLRGGITLPLLLYLAVYLFATFVTRYPVHIAGFIEDKWVVMCYLVALGLVENGRCARELMVTQIIAGSLGAVYAVFQSAVGYDYIRGKELETVGSGHIALGTFSHHLTFGGVALVVFLLALGWLVFAPGAIRKGWKIAATLITGAGLFVSYARSAVVGLTAAGGVIILAARSRIRNRLLIGGIAVMLAAFLLLPGFSHRFVKAVGGGEQNESPRLRLWLTAVAIIKDHPVLGVGQSNFGFLFDRYKVPGHYDNWDHPHNDMLSVAVDGGLVTLVLFLFIWSAFFRKCAAGLHDPSLGADERWILQVGMAIGAGILVAGLFQNYLTDAEVANLVWFNVGLSMRVADGGHPA